QLLRRGRGRGRCDGPATAPADAGIELVAALGVVVVVSRAARLRLLRREPRLDRLALLTWRDLSVERRAVRDVVAVLVGEGPNEVRRMRRELDTWMIHVERGV